jgi:hypothetical protein
MKDEAQDRSAEACWQFAAAFYATSYPAETQ